MGSVPDFYEGIGDEVKFLMYSGHDWFISNQLLFLNATNFTEFLSVHTSLMNFTVQVANSKADFGLK